MWEKEVLHVTVASVSDLLNCQHWRVHCCLELNAFFIYISVRNWCWWFTRGVCAAICGNSPCLLSFVWIIFNAEKDPWREHVRAKASSCSKAFSPRSGCLSTSSSVVLPSTKFYRVLQNIMCAWTSSVSTYLTKATSCGFSISGFIQLEWTRVF